MTTLFADNVQAVLVLGALLGVLYGLAGQWSGFCAVRGLHNHWYLADSRKLRGFALAMATALVLSQWMAFHGLVNFGDTHFTPRSPSVIMIPLGGLLFGIGMALANACGARSLVLLGGGNLRSLVTLLALGIGAGMTLSGLLAPLRIWLEDATRATLPATTWPELLALSGLGPDMAMLLCTLVLAGALLFWALKSPTFRWSPKDWLGGLAVGLMVPAAWWITAVAGADDFEPVRVTALTFVAPVGHSLEYLMLSTGTSLRFGVVVVGGIVAGSLVMALLTRRFHWQSFDSPGHMGRSLIGGLLMGFGGVMALGCTLGQGVSGFSTLAIMTIPALIGIIAGARIGFRLIR